MTDSSSGLRDTIAPARLFSAGAFSRMAGAPLIPGNRVRLLINAADNYPAWMDAISAAKESIHFETYALHADKVGQDFADLFVARAQEGVTVCVLYDWLGARSAASFRFWRRLRQAGVHVKCFNRPHLDDPAEWLRRDHRKLIVVDRTVGFVSGLCVGKQWVGDPQRNLPPWRDTGLRIDGPAVLAVDRAFIRMWNAASGQDPLDSAAIDQPSPGHRGNVALRIVVGEPNLGGLYRLDLLIAALARKSIWLTDAYFIATPSYVQSLRAAAFDGVDVRLLVPRTSDVPVVRALSRVGYRSLLEAGVRIFEWNGSMLHAKTAVADGLWSRVGSTNLNLASWMGNYELDVVVEDEAFSRSMQTMYLHDLEHATEIVLREGARVKPLASRKRRRRLRGVARESAGRAAKGVVAMGSTVGAAMARPRLLGPAETPLMFTVGLVLLGVAVLTGFFPRIVGFSLAVLCAWFGLTLLLKAFRVDRSSRQPSDGSGKTTKRIQ